MEESFSKGDAEQGEPEKESCGAGEGTATNQNMISNLPLLFANGYPVSLEKITDRQLEKFIPFMVQCSLGHVQSNPGSPSSDDLAQASTPAWWPEDMPFTMPNFSERPASYSEEEWTRKLKELVCMCYEYHNNVFLLRFCAVLSNYNPECLRFINNYNSTTSIYDRFNNKLLVTFRNENMLYDKQYNANRICLLPRRKSHAVLDGGDGDTETSPDDASRPVMVEPPLFDIYLCDYCDAELYSLEACREHERTCRETDSDVILCEDDDDCVPVQLTEDSSAAALTIASAVKLRNRKKFPPKENSTNTGGSGPKRTSVSAQHRFQGQRGGYDLDSPASEDQEDSKDGRSSAEPQTSCGPDEMQSFLMQHFQLVSTTSTCGKRPSSSRGSTCSSPRKNGKLVVKAGSSSSNDKKRRNDRSMLTLNRCAVVPLTSPMGKFLLKRQKTMVCREYMLERMDRMERFCPAPILKEGFSKPRWLTMSGPPQGEQPPITYRPIDYRLMFAEAGQRFDSKYVHKYRPARRQFSQRSRELGWLELTRVLLRSCRPCSVSLVRLTEGDIRMYFLNLAIEKKKRELMELQRADMMRMFMQQQRQLKRPAECIDLCSSSDEDEGAEVEVVDGPITSRSTGTGVDESRETTTSSSGKRMRFHDSRGEAKENEGEGVGGGVISASGGILGPLELLGNKGSSPVLTPRYVKILPKLGVRVSSNNLEDVNVAAPPALNGLQSPTKLLIERNHSAIQSTNPLAQQTTLTLPMLGTGAAQLGVTWGPTAQLGALPPSDCTKLHASTLQLVPMPQTQLVLQTVGGEQLSTAAAINCQPSYLFLTKQDVLYQPSFTVSTTTETPEPVPGRNEVMEQTELTNSTINSQRSPPKTRRGSTSSNKEATASMAATNIRLKANQPILMPKTSLSSECDSTPVDRIGQSSKPAVPKSLVSEGALARRSTVCDSFVGLPKKLPSLIRIAPAAIGGK